LFTLLEKAPEPWVRSDIIIALGDLSSRHTSEVTPWTPHLYQRLRDLDAGVRKNTLMVLSHLILNETVQVTGYISEIALCVEDANELIADLAKLFFNELNNKGSAHIYNIIPDVLSNFLSSGVQSATLRNIMKFLLAFVDKEMHTKNLVEKLCMRIRETTGSFFDFHHC
jgi:condensin complex subunit 1